MLFKEISLAGNNSHRRDRIKMIIAAFTYRKDFSTAIKWEYFFLKVVTIVGVGCHFAKKLLKIDARNLKPFKNVEYAL